MTPAKSSNKTTNGKSGISAAVTNLRSGLTNDSPNACDSSTKCSGPNVASEGVRSGVAQSHSLGGRTA